MNKKVFYLFGLAVFCLLLPSSGYADKLVIQTHNSNQHSFTDANGELRGKPKSGTRAFYIELVREIMKDLDYEDISITDVPFKRGYIATQRTQDHAIFNIAMNDRRKPYFRWVGPIWTFNDYFVRPADSNEIPKTLEEAKSMRVCVVRGNIHDQELSQKGFEKLIRRNNYSECMKMLSKDQADLTASAISSLPDKIENAGIKPDAIELTDVLVSSHEGYIAFSKKVSNHVIDKWQTALDMIKKDGRYEQLQKAYLKETAF